LNYVQKLLKATKIENILGKMTYKCFNLIILINVSYLKFKFFELFELLPLMPKFTKTIEILKLVGTMYFVIVLSYLVHVVLITKIY
jgi:hypothetical protein